ncbi:MAG: hypothetical protein U1E62_26300 [Alsobacter sp.]
MSGPGDASAGDPPSCDAVRNPIGTDWSMPQRHRLFTIALSALLAGGPVATRALAEQGGESPTGSINHGVPQREAGAPPHRTAQPEPAPRSSRSPPDPDQDLAREAMSRGLVVPLDRVLRKAADFVPGDMLDVRLRSTREGSWIYEIRMLSSDGRIRVVVIDAARNDVIEVRRP